MNDLLASIGEPETMGPIHVIGIGGAGMSAIATVLVAMGHQVSGSDLAPSATTARLEGMGIPITIGHRSEAVHGAALVTHSTAVRPENPERVRAQELGIAVVTRAEILAAIAARRRCLAVSGTHGKTTTSSMVALIMIEAGLRPSYLIGGDVHQLGTNARWDTGAWIVIEADESDGSFLHLRPEIAVITNVEADHLDHYGTFEAVRSAFAEFLALTSGRRVVCSDDPEAAVLGRAADADMVGEEPLATWGMSTVTPGRTSISFVLEGPRRPAGDDGPSQRWEMTVAAPGRHNARNAAVATVAAMAAGAPGQAAVAALGRFGGVARRFELRGVAGGITFVDDYAHLPTEVRATMAAAAEGRWHRVVAVFQPHRYTRTAEVGEEFATAFDGADVVVLTDVYGAGEAPLEGVSGMTVVNALRRSRPDLEVHYEADRARLASVVGELLEPDDLCLTMGAGDLTALPDELLARWSEQ